MRLLKTALLVVLLAAFSRQGMAALAGGNYGQVSGEMVNVRAGPGMTFDVLTALKKNDIVEIEATEAGWHSIKWPHDLPVWVAKEGVQLQPASEAEQTALVRVAAPVRGIGMRKSEPLCTLDPGAKVVVLGELNGWLKIKAPESLHAFISAKYVAACAPKPELQGAPVPAPFASLTPPVPVVPPASAALPAPIAEIVEAPPAPSPVAAAITAPVVEEKEKVPAAAVPKPAIACIEESTAPQAPEAQQVPASTVAAAPAPVSTPVIAAAAPKPIERREPPAPTTVSAAHAIQSGDRYGALQLNDRNFRDVVENKGVAMVDFNAHWCGPCRRMSPVVDTVAWELKDDVAIAKLDVDEGTATAGRFGVSRIPCLILFRDGREISRRYGACSKDDVKNWIVSR